MTMSTLGNARDGVRTWIEIHQKSLKNNCGVFRRLIGAKCLLMAVVKSNAYGHGLIDFSLTAEKLGVDWFGVDSIIEAETLRHAGLKKPILVLGYTLQSKIDDAIQNDISITVGDMVSLKRLRTSRFAHGVLKIHLKVDTGMHRQGFFLSEIPEVIKILQLKKTSILLEGVFTHFSSAKNPAFPAITLQQIEEYKKIIDALELAGFSNFIKHTAATSGTLLFPESHFDMVRIGIGLYGLWPSVETKSACQKKIRLQPVLSWKTIVGSLKKLSRGSSVGYDLTETVTRASLIALLPIGYWHGFPRALSSIGYVIINGMSAKIIGRVSMDMVCVDVTDVKKIQCGDEVTIVGNDGLSSVTIDELAHLSDTIQYEFVTRINPLIKKIVV